MADELVFSAIVIVVTLLGAFALGAHIGARIWQPTNTDTEPDGGPMSPPSLWQIMDAAGWIEFPIELSAGGTCTLRIDGTYTCTGIVPDPGTVDATIHVERTSGRPDSTYHRTIVIASGRWHG
jgi:hypothetical protein